LYFTVLSWSRAHFLINKFGISDLQIRWYLIPMVDTHTHTHTLQRLTTYIPCLHIFCHDDLFKVAHLVSYDWRRKPSWLFKLRGYFLLTSLSSQKKRTRIHLFREVRGENKQESSLTNYWQNHHGFAIYGFV